MPLTYDSWHGGIMKHTTVTDRPTLRRPFLVAAFEGWNDAGEAATTALGVVADALDATTFARVDSEEFYDFQDTRPTVHLVDGGAQREIHWPQVVFQAAKLPDGERDLILLRGHEPNLRWKAFIDEILEVAQEFGVEMVVTAGALLADVPHTRPIQVMGSAGDPALASELGLAPSRYEGPVGILGVLSEAALHAAIPTVSLWGVLPHYVQAPNPRAALALVERLRTLLNLPVDTNSLAEESAAFDATMAHIVSDDPDLAGYVERLETQADQQELDDDDDEVGTMGSRAPLSDLAPEQFVAEVERFLRDHPGGRS
jgi:proteasome assembly chaperone (PAC2) family protein